MNPAEPTESTPVLADKKSRLLERKRQSQKRPRQRPDRKTVTENPDISGTIIQSLKNRKYRQSVSKAVTFDDANLKENALKLLEKSEKKVKLLSPKKEKIILTENEKVDFFSRVWQETIIEKAKNNEQMDDTSKSDLKSIEEGIEQIEVIIKKPYIKKHNQIKGKDAKHADVRKDSHAIILSNEIDDEFSMELSEDYKKYDLIPAEHESWSDRYDVENENYFIASNGPVNIEKKLGECESIYDKEGEGFYVGTRPEISESNVNRVEQRIIKQHGEDISWFEKDGTILKETNLTQDENVKLYNILDLDEVNSSDYQYFHEPVCQTNMSYNLIDFCKNEKNKYEIVIDVNRVQFKHHHLFSKEHVIATRLETYYHVYLERQKIKSAQFLTNKIESIRTLLPIEKRKSVVEQKESIKQENVNIIKKNIEIDKDEKLINDFKEKEEQGKWTELKKLKHLRKIEMKADQNVKIEILKLWRIIKNLRSEQNYTNTSLKLVIKKNDIDTLKYEKDLKREISRQLSEARQISKNKFSQNVQFYRQEMQKWHDKKSNIKNDDNEDIEPPIKPKKSDKSIDKQSIKDEIKSYWPRMSIMSISFRLLNTEVVTSDDQVIVNEKKRRQDVSKTKIFAKIFYNSKLATTIEPVNLSQDFIVNFLTQYTLRIVEWPQIIRLKLFEVCGLKNYLLTDIPLLIPNKTQNIKNSVLDKYEFSSDVKLMHNHCATGSGVCFKIDTPEMSFLKHLLPKPVKIDPKNDKTLEKTKLVDEKGQNNSAMTESNVDEQMKFLNITEYTTASVFSSVAWNMDENGKILAPKMMSKNKEIYSGLLKIDPIAAIGMSGLNNVSQLANWAKQNNIDPNNPLNSDIIYLLKCYECNKNLKQEIFRIEPLLEPFNFVNDVSLNNDKRFKLLTFRHQGVDPYSNFVFVPVKNTEIKDSVFDKPNLDLVETRVKLDSVQIRRRSVLKYMKMVRDQVMRRYKLSADQKILSDVVNEEAVPQIDTLIPQLLKLFEPRRPLRPTRKERKTATTQLFKNTGLKVLINVVRALDVPVCVEKSSGDYDSNQALVNPFIQVIFQKQTYNTFIAEGPNPSWNEEIKIDFKAPNDDYSMTSLLSSNETIYISLFDNFVEETTEEDYIGENEDDADDNEIKSTNNIVKRTEKRWLGTLQLPFSSLFTKTRMEGTFCMERPPVLLGYKFKSEMNKVSNKEVGINMSGASVTDRTYLTLFATLEPPVALSSRVVPKFDSNEDIQFLEICERWQAELELKFPKRPFVTTVIDVSGRSVFVTRYCTKDGIKPPDELLESSVEDYKSKLLARFVSLVPFVSDAELFSGICDIWSTCDQFLYMLQGDDEEHALLLLAYFKYIGKSAWLLLCSAIPEGRTCYVLTKESNEYLIWNPNTGESFANNDPYCPVQVVGCIIDETNIYANVQANEKPCEVDFGVSNASKWKPFFTSSFPNNGISSIQPEYIRYTKPDVNAAVSLQYHLEQLLKKKIMHWRNRYITRWNRHCIHTFRTLLQKLEENNGHGNFNEHSDELASILTSYKLSGFPINVKFADEEALIENIYSTGVFKVDSQGVEFALAIYVHPYSNGIMSVWIYFASMLRKK